MLRIQASSSGPPHDRQPRNPRTNSRQNQEATYSRNTEPLLDTPDVWLDERPLPSYHAPQDESSDSTHTSSKRRRGRKSQLPDMMCTRLGPQTSGMEKLRATAA